MFEAAETGRKLSRSEFDALEKELRTELLAAQFRARDAGVPIIIIVSGVEGAGKGQVVDRLNEWLDTRGIEVRAFWDETDEERERPEWWRYWRAMPPGGRIGVFFGSWYTRPIVEAAFEDIDGNALDRRMRRIEATERMLAEDGAVLVKLWFHLDRDTQQERLKADLRARARVKKKGKKGKKGKDGKDKLEKLSPLLEQYAKSYDDFVRVSERAIRMTDSGHSPWHVIEANDARYRDFRAGQVLLDALRRRERDEEAVQCCPVAEVEPPALPSARRTVLDQVDLDASMDRKEYKERLEAAQARLYRLAWAMREQRRNVVGVFEGWDASGKGGAIRRLTQGMDARLYRTLSVAAPTDEERAHHYLWRFWRHVPMRGNMTLYDRSWYGRVLVERVEELATEDEWRRAYLEINDFEEQLWRHGTLILKFWLHVSPAEQLERFRERERTPWKAHKITDEDWRNRERWHQYELAVNEMVARTSTDYAPWALVPANCKHTARVQVLETFCGRMAEMLD